MVTLGFRLKFGLGLGLGQARRTLPKKLLTLPSGPAAGPRGLGSACRWDWGWGWGWGEGEGEGTGQDQGKGIKGYM